MAKPDHLLPAGGIEGDQVGERLHGGTTNILIRLTVDDQPLDGIQRVTAGPE